MLQALIRENRLTAKERKAFEGMLKSVGGGQKLSVIQRDWARDVYAKYGLKAEFNLISDGLAARGKEVRLPYEDLPRPKKPPGRT